MLRNDTGRIAVDVACAVARRNTVRRVEGDRHAVALDAHHAVGPVKKVPARQTPW